jgi:hypothetical protein
VKHLETSLPGLACLLCGLLLFIFGAHTPESVISAGACVAAGIGFLRSADASKTVQKADLPDMQVLGNALHSFVRATSEADEKKGKQ